jgi:hypothetical protein
MSVAEELGIASALNRDVSDPDGNRLSLIAEKPGRGQ